MNSRRASRSSAICTLWYIGCTNVSQTFLSCTYCTYGTVPSSTHVQLCPFCTLHKGVYVLSARIYSVLHGRRSQFPGMPREIRKTPAPSWMMTTPEKEKACLLMRRGMFGTNWTHVQPRSTSQASWASLNELGVYMASHVLRFTCSRNLFSLMRNMERPFGAWHEWWEKFCHLGEKIYCSILTHVG